MARQAAFSPTVTTGQIRRHTSERKRSHSHQRQKQDEICSDQTSHMFIHRKLRKRCDYENFCLITVSGKIETIYLKVTDSVKWLKIIHNVIKTGN